MTDIIAKYMTRPVPRYTSYPTVPHFNTDVTGEHYGQWLESLPTSEPISLYLHVPYCRQACWYCGCNMKLAARPEPVASYAATLMREISQVATRLPDRLTISHLHWGGGTPTSLTPDDLECTMEVVRTHFDIAPEAELAIESDPRTLTKEMTRRIGALGFTRASFGVQEFDAKVQAAINRVQPPDMVARAVDALRTVGVEAINFDLIYGLPHQTVDTLFETIGRCAEMRPDRIALFGYAHVPWMAKRQRMIPEDALPGAAERLRQARVATAELERLGYQPIGLDHFALPGDALAAAARAGTLHRNFQGYTTDGATTLIGVGATSIGRTPSGYVQNIPETGAWARAVAAGDLPVAKGHRFVGEDGLRGAVIEALMCTGQADLEAEARRFGATADWADTELDALRPLAAEGLVTLNGGQVRLTEVGGPLVRVIAAVFDTYFQRGVARHSAAV